VKVVAGSVAVARTTVPAVARSRASWATARRRG
jgi:hypothetical protein